ncbi:MAG: hypothetical protein ACU0CO_15570 [Shimia sp.]
MQDATPDGGAGPETAQPQPGADAILGRVSLVGRLRIETLDGTDCTPRGPFPQAILAVVLLSRGGEVPRDRLTALLWPNSEAAAAQNKLRVQLSGLRTKLAPIGVGLIPQDGPVSLPLAAFDVDLFAGARGAPLLDGLALPRNRSSPEFDEWLRDERARWDTDAPLPAPLALRGPGDDPARPVSERAPIPRPSAAHRTRADAIPARPTARHVAVPEGRVRDEVLRIGLRPLASDARGASGAMGAMGATALAARLAERVVAQAASIAPTVGPIALAADGAAPVVPSPHVVVRPELLHDGQTWQLDLAILAPVTEKEVCRSVLVLTPEGEVVDEGAVAAVVFELTDRLTMMRGHLLASDPDLMRQCREILGLAFRLDPASRRAAREAPRRAAAARPDPVFDALLAYLATIDVGENVHDGEPTPAQVDLALRAADHAHAGGAAGVYLTLTGYALEFLAADTERARAFLRRATEVAPELAMAWDHLAMSELWAGDSDAAVAAGQRAVATGHHSQLIGTFETSLCMAALAAGDYRRALHYGKRAMARKAPLADAALYSLAAAGHLGERGEIDRLRARLERRSPGLSLAIVADRASVRMTDDTRARLIEGLRRARLRAL